MNYIKIKELCNVDFDIKGAKANNAVFPINVEIDYLNEGRQRYLIHMLTDGTRVYKTNTESFTITSGTLVFLPHGTKYYTKSLDVGKPYCKGISIIFDLEDAHKNLLPIENSTLHIRRDTHGIFLKLINKMLNCSLEEPNNILKMKSNLFRLLLEIAKEDISSPPAELEPAFEMLATRYKENLAVKEYAERCHMSESYFRKKFTAYAGRSPIQYRNELRFSEARKLYSEGHTIHEIAEELGFFDAGYFSKLYKQCNGHTLRSEVDKDIV